MQHQPQRLPMEQKIIKSGKTACILSIVLTFLLILSFLYGCKNKAKTDNHGIKVVVGPLTWEEWQKDAGWKSYSADDYIPLDNLLDRFSELANSKDVSFLLFSASWCPDSKSEMPKIYKLFKSAGIPFEKIQLFGLDLKKEEPSGIAQDHQIERVPTLLVLKDLEEIGRVVEFPSKTWEEDLLMILEK